MSNKIILKDRKVMDEESLENIIGGAAGGNPSIVRIACCKCQRHFPANISKASIKCPYCGEINTFAG